MADSLIVLAVVIGASLAVRLLRRRFQEDDVRKPSALIEGRRQVGGTRCQVCRATVVEEDSRFCPRCGARLGRPIGS